MSLLRPYQQSARDAIHTSWQSGHRNVLAVLPTGAGKTVLFSHIIAEARAAAVAVAHRAELVSQMSLALARNGIYHKVIGAQATKRNCSALHIAELKRNFVAPQSRVAVASVDTLIRMDKNDPWLREVQLLVTDEAHHLTAENKWGDAVELFPNARGLGVTATPMRADGKGLGRHADGVMDDMIVGPSMRELINAGYLTEYRIYAPPSDLDLSSVPVSASGDFSPKPLANAVHKSHITGDVVQHYLRIAPGKRGISFCVDIEAASELTAAFRAAGVKAEIVTGKTPDMLRAHIFQQFRNGAVHQLITVDIVSEGTDIPAVEVISMARPTQSYGLFVQQFGRALRPMEGKTHAIILDHVGNTLRHGLPDAPRQWSLDRRDRRTRTAPSDVIPLRVCVKCLAAYERIHAACPYCGTRPVPATRGTPDTVDGDLAEMSPELLAQLRGEIAAVEAAPKFPMGAGPEVVGAIKKRHRERLEALGRLKEAMALYGGWRAAEGDSVAETQRRWYLTFGVDVLSAQALGRAEAEALEARVRKVLTDAAVVGIVSEQSGE